MFMRVIIKNPQIFRHMNHTAASRFTRCRKNERDEENPQRHNFSGCGERLMNVTSSTPFFRVFCIDATSTGGSAADVR